jgi:hypothetical protein
MGGSAGTVPNPADGGGDRMGGSARTVPNPSDGGGGPDRWQRYEGDSETGAGSVD